ncbi:MAG TPA: tetratricopeptide repeat protein [Chthoniobacterales bacterium]|nr:tetratricopeptide repeat protein [Chthoniobacterales bacterium]
MRLCVLIFLGLASAAIAAPQSDRDLAYDKLQKDAHATALLHAIDQDVKDHRYDAALKKADEALAIRPNDPGLLNAKGAALIELRRFAEADKILEAAVAADPKALAPQFNQFESLFLQKKYSDAVLQLIDLQTQFGPLPIVKYHTYLCYALSGEQTKASNALAAMRYPQDGSAWYFAYAADRLLNGKKGEAKKLMAVAESIDKDGALTYRDTLRDADLLK